MRAMFYPVFLALLGLGFFEVLTVPAKAGGTFTWLGIGDSNDWEDTNGNWEIPGTDPYPGYLSISDTAVFGDVHSQSYTPILGNNLDIGNIIFNMPGYTFTVTSSPFFVNGITATYATAPNLDNEGYIDFKGTITAMNLTGSHGDFFSDSGTSNLTVLGTGTYSGDIMSDEGVGALSLTVGDATHTASLTLASTDSLTNYPGTTLVNANATLVASTAGSLSASSAQVINGTLTLSSSNAVASLSGTGSVNLGANTLTIANGGATFGGSISGTGGALTKSGTGTQTLTGSNTYSGGTTVSAGTLKVNNATGSGTGSGAVDVKSGATIGGGNGAGFSGTLATLGTGSFVPTLKTYTANTIGMIAGPLTLESGAHLAPGNSVGTLTAATLTLNSGSILDYEFNGTANDFTAVSTANGLALNGGSFNLVQENTSTTFAQAGTYDLIGYSGNLSGSVANLAVSNPATGFTYSFVNDSTDHLIQLDIAAVPEPSTWGLLGLSLAVLGFYSRRPVRPNARAFLRFEKAGE